MITVDVIVAANGSMSGYNRLAESILFQHTSNFEIRRVICASEHSPWMHLFDCSCDNTASSARNEGLNYSRADYVLFLDHDDYIYGQSTISEAVKTAEATDADIVCVPRFVGFKDDGSEYDLNFTTAPIKVVQAQGKSVQCGLRDLLDMTFVVWGKLYRRTFLDTHKIRFNEDYSSWEDNEFLVDCFKFGPWVAVATGGAWAYNIGTDSMTRPMTADFDLINKRWEERASSIKEIMRTIKGYYARGILQQEDVDAWRLKFALGQGHMWWQQWSSVLCYSTAYISYIELIKEFSTEREDFIPTDCSY